MQTTPLHIRLSTTTIRRATRFARALPVRSSTADVLRAAIERGLETLEREAIRTVADAVEPAKAD